MIKINLVAKKVPPEHVLIRKQFLILAALMMVSILGSAVWANSAVSTRADIKQKLEVEKAELKRLQAVKVKYEEFQKKEARRKEILKAIKKLENRRKGPSPFLDFLNVVLPSDIWLEKIKERDQSITITGYTFSSQAVAELMRSIEGSKYFSKVELSEIQRRVIKGEEVKTFIITTHWNIEGSGKSEEKSETEEKG
jgi:type IV pilus assembly protein PilN